MLQLNPQHYLDHSQILNAAHKAVIRGRVGIIVLPILGFICIKYDYIPTNKIFLGCVIYLLMVSWENTLSKIMSIAENIVGKQKSNKFLYIQNQARLTNLIQKISIIIFIVLGTFFAEDHSMVAKNNIIISFIVIVIIEFMINPTSRLLKLIK